MQTSCKTFDETQIVQSAIRLYKTPILTYTVLRIDMGFGFGWLRGLVYS